MSNSDPWILLVDDDLEFGKILEVYLKKLGVRLVVTTNIEDFVATLKGGDLPTLCLVDLTLNGLIAGYTLIIGLRKKFGLTLPIMIISATNDLSAISHAIECGADDYIIKPIDPQVLNTKIGRYIKVTKNLENKIEFTKSPVGGLPAQIGFEVLVKSMDELSISVISPHLICKGAPANFFGSVIDQFFPDKKKALATVTNCELLANGTYLVSLEFAELVESDLAGLKKFISKKS